MTNEQRDQIRAARDAYARSRQPAWDELERALERVDGGVFDVQGREDMQQALLGLSVGAERALEQVEASL